jgi:hypothetical protein
MINWKIPAGFAAFGAVVSLLAGILGGNPFGVILLRLVLSAVVCAGLGLGVNLVVNKYLPEISSTSSLPAMESGEEVDIVIDEDIPIAEQEVEQQAGEPAEMLETVEAAEPLETPAAGESLIEEQSPIVPDTTEEDAGFAEDILPFEDTATEGQPDAEEAVPEVAAVPVTDFEDLDTLPDIDQFSPSTEESTAKPKGSKRSAQVEEVVRDQDPESLAKAVRTFMKKDQ